MKTVFTHVPRRTYIRREYVEMKTVFTHVPHRDVELTLGENMLR